jgi:hypothetical protein
VKPAARAHLSRKRPASASAPLRAVTWWYKSIHRSRRGSSGGPGERRVVAVADGEQASGLEYAPHLGERRHRIREVLEHLVCVHDVEGLVWQVEGVDVAYCEPHVLDTERQASGAGFGDDVRRDIDPEHRTGRDTTGQIDGDRARTATHVEQPQPGSQRRQKVARGVLRGAPAMAP